MKNLHAKIWAIAPLMLIALSIPSCKKSDTPPPEAPAPSISDFSPKRGGTDTTVVITGTNFDSTASNDLVKFNGAVAAVTRATATQLTVTVPSGVATGKITVTVKSQTSTSVADFKVNTALTLNTTHGITNQLIYLTGGPGFGGSNNDNSWFIYAGGHETYSFILGYNEDTVVLMAPYSVPGVYHDTAIVNGVKFSLGSFKLDTPALTTFGVVGNVTPASAAKGATVKVPVINGSNVSGSTTVALVQLYQHTGTPVSISCTVNSLTAGAFGTTTVSFVVPDAIVQGSEYAVKVTVNGVSSYGGLNAVFTAM